MQVLGFKKNLEIFCELGKIGKKIGGTRVPKNYVLLLHTLDIFTFVFYKVLAYVATYSKPACNVKPKSYTNHQN